LPEPRLFSIRVIQIARNRKIDNRRCVPDNAVTEDSASDGRYQRIGLVPESFVKGCTLKNGLRRVRSGIIVGILKKELSVTWASFWVSASIGDVDGKRELVMRE
jgi:hypothetical protein